MATRKDENLNRRDFMKASLGCVAGSAGLSSPLFANQTRKSPNDRITVALIGVGKMGGGHLGGLISQADLQIIGVCDAWRDRTEAACARVESRYAEDAGRATYSGCKPYHDFRELLSRDDLDAVMIATPDHWHAIMAIEAAKAGKDVYCEKPMTLTVREARAIVNACERYSCLFQTGSQQRSDSLFRLACELVRNGRIGKVQSIYINVGGPAQECDLPPEPVPDVLDWDLWLGPSPYRPYNAILSPPEPDKEFPRWRQYWDYSGGGMTDWGAHHYDIAQWALGMDESGPVEIHPPDGKDFKTLTYRYANGILMFHGGGEKGVDIRGETGRIVVDRGFLRTEPASLARETIGPGEIHLYESSNHLFNWIECMRMRKVPICPPETGCRSVSVCHIGNIAYRLGRSLQWDPVQELFVNDDEANRFLERPMRSPWRV